MNRTLFYVCARAREVALVVHNWLAAVEEVEVNNMTARNPLKRPLKLEAENGEVDRKAEVVSWDEEVRSKKVG